ncbi:RluA family pseudouridine synthase [soil metagenome]
MGKRERVAKDRWIHHLITVEESGRSVQEILTGPLAVSRRMIQRLTRTRGIRLNGRSPRLSGRVKARDRLSVRVAAAEEPGLTPVQMDLRIVFEDADLIVVDKPPSLTVHPTSESHKRTLAHGIAHHFLTSGAAARVRPLHRLDRDTSGLVVIARTEYAHQHLDRQLRQGALKRSYLALAEGSISGDAGTIDEPIGRKPGNPNLRAVMPDGEPAVTHYRVLARDQEMTLLELELETGRTHQIRVHLAFLGHPIVGDRQYGAAARTGITRQALHAHRVSFVHPMSGQDIRLEAPLPADLSVLVGQVQTVRGRSGVSPSG